MINYRDLPSKLANIEYKTNEYNRKINKNI